MTFEQNDLLRRFHAALVREIQAKDPAQLGAPFTVAEVYQNLVPYRTHRDEIGVEMNADYEHALLRLLAGEGDFLTIESRTARQEIREELESPNPNTGLYRDFAAADVRLNPDRLQEVLLTLEGDPENGPRAPVSGGDEDGETPDPEEPESEGMALETAAATDTPLPELDSGGGLPELSEQDHPEADAAEMDRMEHGMGESTLDPSPEDEVEASASSGVAPIPQTCPWCRENLPDRPGVRFCPYCGSNMRLVPCPECGEELELNWRFCVACGTEVAS